MDVEEQTEVIQVPEHNDVYASDVLNDFANVRILLLSLHSGKWLSYQCAE